MFSFQGHFAPDKLQGEQVNGSHQYALVAAALKSWREETAAKQVTLDPLAVALSQ